MNIRSISEKLLTYPMAELESKYCFNQRKSAKVTLLNFIGSFFLSLSEGHSLKKWAIRLSDFLPCGQSLTKAGLQKRFGPSQLSAVKAFLKESMTKRLAPLSVKSESNGWFSHFGRVLLEDSVCVKLNPQLFSLFQGSHSKKGKASTARIQVCLNLPSLSYERFDLMGYRDNDQKFSPQILKLLQAGDLLIRDLGYWALDVFSAIIEKNAFFLTRYKPGVSLYLGPKGEKWDLASSLKSMSRRGGNFVDRTVCVGKKHQLSLRIVALKCPDEVAEQRIRKAKADRHSKANHSPDYYELLKWTIFLTNVDASVWTADQVRLVYGFRWHIEMIFKVWKSKFGLQRLMTKAQIKKTIHAQLFFYLFLSYLVLFYVGYFAYFFEKLYQKHRKILSPFGFAEFLKTRLTQLVQAQLTQTLDQWVEPMAREACYEKRKNRPNQLELIFQLRQTRAMILIDPRPNTP